MVSETHDVNPTCTRAVMNQMEVGTVPQGELGCVILETDAFCTEPRKGYTQLEILDNTILILAIAKSESLSARTRRATAIT